MVGSLSDHCLLTSIRLVISNEKVETSDEVSIDLFENSELCFTLLMGENMMWVNFTEKQSKVWNYCALFLPISVYLCYRWKGQTWRGI